MIQVSTKITMNIAEQIIKDIDFLIEELGFWRIKLDVKLAQLKS